MYFCVVCFLYLLLWLCVCLFCVVTQYGAVCPRLSPTKVTLARACPAKRWLQVWSPSKCHLWSVGAPQFHHRDEPDRQPTGCCRQPFGSVARSCSQKGSQRVDWHVHHAAVARNQHAHIFTVECSKSSPWPGFGPLRYDSRARRSCAQYRGDGTGEIWNGKICRNKSVPNYATAFSGPSPFFSVSLVVLLACTFPLCPRSLLYTDASKKSEPTRILQEIATSFQEITATNQRPIGNKGHVQTRHACFRV